MTTHLSSSAYRWRVVAAAAITLGGVALAPTSGRPAAASDHPPQAPTRVIVQAQAGALGRIGHAAGELGGTVVSTQQSLDTAVLDIPADRVGELREVTGVRSVSEDMSVTLNSDSDAASDSLTSTTGGSGDLLNVAQSVGARDYWKNGYSGQGVDVALLDSGVLPVAGLKTPNKLVIGPDLSFESQSQNLRGMDTFGHGTHMAGIIAGLDGGLAPSAYAAAKDRFVGIAPGSRIVSLKLADAQGQTDVSQVIAGIDWVVTHAQDPGMNIRVLNLSFGTDSTQDYRIDPLAHAAEVAWASGIVVVVAAGNGATAGGGLSNPAYDPGVLAVGSVDTRDDPAVVSTFSKWGNSAAGKRGPDLLAPGNSLVSLRAPASSIDTLHPAGVVNGRFFKGSGTSQSAAVASGAAALLLSQRPSLSPDQVRDLLRRSARSLNASTDAQGEGVLNLEDALDLDRRGMAAPRVNAGGGSLDAARGSVKVRRNGVTLTGERNIFGKRWDSHQVAANEETSSSWTDGAYWNGATWAGATWAGATWTGATWAGATWAGATWTGATWAGATWADNVWSSASWE